jgi:hypothetical protein
MGRVEAECVFDVGEQKLLVLLFVMDAELLTTMPGGNSPEFMSYNMAETADSSRT